MTEAERLIVLTAISDIEQHVMLTANRLRQGSPERMHLANAMQRIIALRERLDHQTTIEVEVEGT
jgi:hypothetical protein